MSGKSFLDYSTKSSALVNATCFRFTAAVHFNALLHHSPSLWLRAIQNMDRYQKQVAHLKWVGETDSKGDTRCNNPPQCYFLRIEIVLCMVVVRYHIWRDQQLHKNLGYCLLYRFIEKYYVWLGVTYIGLDSKKVLTSSSS